MDQELQKLLDDHMESCKECTRDSIDAEGNFTLGAYCGDALNIIIRFLENNEPADQ